MENVICRWRRPRRGVKEEVVSTFGSSSRPLPPATHLHLHTPLRRARQQSSPRAIELVVRFRPDHEPLQKLPIICTLSHTIPFHASQPLASLTSFLLDFTHTRSVAGRSQRIFKFHMTGPLCGRERVVAIESSFRSK